MKSLQSQIRLLRKAVLKSLAGKLVSKNETTLEEGNLKNKNDTKLFSKNSTEHRQPPASLMFSNTASSSTYSTVFEEMIENSEVLSSLRKYLEKLEDKSDAMSDTVSMTLRRTTDAEQLQRSTDENQQIQIQVKSSMKGTSTEV
jgi:hypothetical protein